MNRFFLGVLCVVSFIESFVAALAALFVAFATGFFERLPLIDGRILSTLVILLAFAGWKALVVNFSIREGFGESPFPPTRLTELEKTWSE